jgi:hypothetical protein
VPIATASSAYVLEDRASPTIKAIREEAERATVALRGTAAAGDRIGRPEQMQRLTRFETKLRSVASTAETMSGRVQRTVGHMEGAIRRDTLKAEARLTSLEERLDTLGQKRTTASVELDGYALARAQIASLDRALDALARRHASPRIAASIASTAGGAAGGGARSGAFVGSGGVGFGTTRRGLIAGGLLAALPVASALTGTALPLAGSVVGGGLGAGALGVAGGGALAAGVGGVVSVVKPMADSIKELRKQQEAYADVVREHGKASKEAREAQDKLNAAVRDAPPGARNFAREVDSLTSTWKRVTTPGQQDILGLGAGAARRVRSASPFLGAQANIASGAVREQGLNLAGWATSPSGLIIVRDLTRAFADNLDEAEQTLENVLGTAGNIARASTPFFHEGMAFLEEWTGGWERSTRDIGQTREQIGGYVDDLEAIGHLGGAGFDLIRDLIMPGRQQGTSLVEDLTMQLREWDDWAQRNPAKIRRFYRDSIDGTKELAGLLATIGADLHDLANLLLPVLSRFAQLGQIAGGSGLLLPTLLRVGIGRAMGGRDGGAASTGVAGAIIAGGTAAGTAGRRTAGGAIAASAAAAPIVYGQGYRSGDAQHPALQRSATTAGASGRFAGARARVAGGARSAVRFGGPVAGISAALGASGTQGDITERLQGALAGLSFGLFDQPTTRAQARESGEARATDVVERLGDVRSPADYARQIVSLERRRRRAAAGSRVSTGGGLFGGSGALGLFEAGRGGDGGPTEKEALANAAAAKKYAAAIRELRAEQRSYAREQSRRSGVASELHGDQLAQSYQTGYGTLRTHEGPERALQDTLGSAVARMRKMRPEGAKVLGESMLAWARTIAKGNPKLQAVVQDMTDDVEQRFSRLGRRVEVVNDRILTGSRQEWRQIGQALSDPAEQARQKVMKAFTAIQREAVGSLRAMGYSSAEARGLIAAREQGGDAEENLLGGISASHGDTAASRARAPHGDGIGDGPGRAGTRKPIGGVSTGGLMGAKSGLGVYAEDAASYGLRVSSGLRRGAITSSGNVSYHASGNAIDLAGSPADMMRYARHASSTYGSRLEELIYTPLGKGQVKDGKSYVYSGQVARDHLDHVHVADTGVGGLAGGGIGGGTYAVGAGGQRVRLHRPRSGVGGVSGALADRAASIYAGALEQRINAGGAAPGGAAGGGGSNRALARRMMLAYGGGKWGAGQWGALNALWTRESNFDENARNKSSGAAGIVQDITGNMHGGARGQIDWGLGYIDKRYGSPAAAFAHSQRVGWYGSGGSGTARRPTLIGIGDHPRGEDFKVTPTRLGPPSSRAGGRGSGGHGLGSVTIQSMTVHWAREGDLTKAVKEEVLAAFAQLADELDEGVDADEDALMR